MKGKRLANEDALQRVKQGMALLTSGRKIASDTTEVSCSVRRAETARYFLLEFDHPQVAFRTIVIERHTRVRKKAQDFIASSLQAVDKATRCWLQRGLVLRRVGCQLSDGRRAWMIHIRS